MKIETLTPQIAAMYLGQKCTCKWIESGDSADFPISTLTLNDLSYGLVVVTPHLRQLDSLTEAEARELYEIETGETWMSAIYCYDEWWNHGGVAHEETYQFLIGSPAVWLHLLSKGFDLFGLLDAGLAKERPTSNGLPHHPFGVDVRRNNAFFEGVGGEGVKTVNSSQLKFDKMTTILDALQNANYNLQNAKMPLQLEMAKAQLHNAVTLLEKDYDLHDDIGEILSKYERVEDAPEKISTETLLVSE